MNLLEGEPIGETVRGITPETFAHWKYTRTKTSDGTVHLANHFKDGRLIGQKIRGANKKFSVKGELDDLYGRWLWPNNGKRVIITEGELDALSVSQVQGNKWPVVSVPNGAQGAAKSIRKAIDWLLGFEEIVLMLDNDEVGITAAVECAQLLPPGRVKIARLPLKDANEMLKAGQTEELVRAIWNASPYRPDGIVTPADVREKALAPVEIGYPWCWPALTEATFGRRPGEVYTLGAGTGVGKTDVFTQQAMYDLTKLELNVGILFLEQAPAETATRMAGKLAGRRFHIPNAGWTQDEKAAAVDTLIDTGRLFMYDSFGATEWEVISSRIEYMATALGCQSIYLDHLTALAAAEDDERKALEKIMAEAAGLAKRLNIMLHVISHLATPEKGASHEEGGRVTIRHFKGSRAIGFWSHFMFGLERDQQAEDIRMRHITVYRCLKDRNTGNATGFTFYLGYDQDTGSLFETTLPEDDSGSHGFDDETL